MSEKEEVKKVLDKAALDESFDILALRLPTQLCGKYVLAAKPFLIKHFKTVEADPSSPDYRLLCFAKDVKEIPKAVQDVIDSDPEKSKITVSSFRIVYGYDQMTAEEVLRKVLPAGIELVTGFESIGHIAHMNLKEDSLPYKYIIGQVILDKNKAVRTVVNKTDEIHTVFRTFPMEVLAGENDMNAEVKESNCRFRFNFAEVYWNSKLGQEHWSLVQTFKPGQIVADMFGGVGPFAIPAAKEGCIVHANDLNPKSYHYLKENIEINHVQKNVTPYNLDGRDFITLLVRNGIKFDHAIMNLPASAVTFLDVFRGLLPPDWGKKPTIHCYGFSKDEDPEKDIVKQSEAVLGHRIESFTVHRVRSVSPKKWMMRISFVLPDTDRPVEASEAVRSPKRQRTDE